MPGDRLTVSFCCNDEHGNPLDFIQGVEVGELIRLEGPMDFDDGELSATTSFAWYRWFPPAVVIDGEIFLCHGRSRHVGSLTWDAAGMDRAEVVRLLNHLRTLGGWSCIEAEASLFDAWRGRDITVVDMERAIEA